MVRGEPGVMTTAQKWKFNAETAETAEKNPSKLCDLCVLCVQTS